VRAGGPQRFVHGDAFFEVEYQLDRLIHEFPKPVVVYIHGICMGGGIGLTAGASHRVVSDGARVAMPEIQIGMFPDVGGGWFLNRVPGGAGLVMALTGLTINEADMLFAAWPTISCRGRRAMNSMRSCSATVGPATRPGTASR